MTGAKSHAYFSPEEYLEIERVSPVKHDYLQGRIEVVDSASKVHAIITSNLSALLVNHLSTSGGIAYATDMKVHLPKLNLFYYPDLSVTGDDRDHIANQDFILHPKLIVEVLSESTEAVDRGDKFWHYQSIAELEEYMLVHQTQVLVERFQRKSDHLWMPQVYQTGDRVEFSSIGFTCAIADLYDNLEQLSE